MESPAGGSSPGQESAGLSANRTDRKTDNAFLNSFPCSQIPGPTFIGFPQGFRRLGGKRFWCRRGLWANRKILLFNPLGNAASVRYSPADFIRIEKTLMKEVPDVSKTCTSHIANQNLTHCMHYRRLTWLTNAFSRKLENIQAAVSLDFAYYNFCKSPLVIRCIPAMEAGVEKSQWTVAELVERCGE
jgi:hypothetical protein